MQILRRIPKITTVILLILTLNAVHGKTVEGRVISVTDGDTLTMLLADKKKLKIRLTGIDAPEKRQSYGAKSKEHLASLVYQKIVKVEYSRVDRYQRTLGKVLMEGIDINLEQVLNGFAWHYKTYAKDQSVRDQNEYSKAEVKAKRNRRGLWQDERPQPPWEFRKGANRPSSPERKTDYAPIKLSRNGICHEPQTSYYERTIHFTPFKALEECLSAGGRTPHR